MFLKIRDFVIIKCVFVCLFIFLPLVDLISECRVNTANNTNISVDRFYYNYDNGDNISIIERYYAVFSLSKANYRYRVNYSRKKTKRYENGINININIKVLEIKIERTFVIGLLRLQL